MQNSVNDCKILGIQSKETVVTLNKKDLFFDIKRIYYLYGIPENQERGAHAHKNLYQLILAASGSFTVELDDGNKKKQFNLSCPSQGLIIVPGIWRNLTGFSHGAVALVFASEYYTETDYIRNYDDFLHYRKMNTTR